MSYIGKNHLRRQMLVGRALRHQGFGDDTGDPNIEIDTPTPGATPAQQGSTPSCPSGQFYVAGSGCVTPPPDAGTDLFSSIKSGVSSITSSLENLLSGASQQVASSAPSSGAAAAVSAQDASWLTSGPGGGPSLTTLAVAGAVGYGIYHFVFKKKRSR